MPRHPPNALLTLDRSHCQCPSFMARIACPKSRRLFGHAARPCCHPLLRAQQDQHPHPKDASATQNIIGVFRYVLDRRHAERLQNISDQLLEMCPMTRGQATPIVMILVRYLLVQIAYPKSHPTFWASGRSSGDPLSKGTVKTPANKQQRSIIRHDCLSKGCKPCHNEAAFRHNLLFTMYAQQALPRQRKLYLFRMRFSRSGSSRSRPYRPSTMAWPARARCISSDGRSALPSLRLGTLLTMIRFGHAAFRYATQRTRPRAGDRSPPRPEPARRAYGVRTQNGGANRDRTDDPLLAKQVLSQLSYSPVIYRSR